MREFLAAIVISIMVAGLATVIPMPSAPFISLPMDRGGLGIVIIAVGSFCVISAVVVLGSITFSRNR